MARMIPETMLEFDPQGRKGFVFNAQGRGCGEKENAVDFTIDGELP